jgi:ketosteroid isomerase-like protein
VSQQDIDIVKEGFAALERGGLEAMLEYVHPEFEFTTSPELALEPDTYHGHEGLRRYFDSFYDAMDEVRFVPAEFIAVEDRVVVPVTLIARGKETGIEATQELVQVWSLRDGKAIGIETFVTREQAIEAARGPAEPGA